MTMLLKLMYMDRFVIIMDSLSFATVLFVFLFSSIKATTSITDREHPLHRKKNVAGCEREFRSNKVSIVSAIILLK
uniref:Uncharacterized protein n=1 Tax=Aegilops tauschii subsp. strangulata TaxID=200361 RepID=A0A452XXZ4_AEGTS